MTEQEFRTGVSEETHHGLRRAPKPELRLWDKMRALAPQRADGPDLIAKADALEEAHREWSRVPQLMGEARFGEFFAAAWFAWCRAIGDPLV